MEALIKQARSKFRGTEELSSIRGRTPTEKTSSSRGESGPQKWIRRRLSRQLSSQQSGEEAEHTAAVAAAAAVVAITSLEEDGADQRQIRDEPWTSLPRARSRLEDITYTVGEPDQTWTSYTGDRGKDSQIYQNLEAPSANTEGMTPEKTIHPVPSTRKTPYMPRKGLTFADQLPKDSAGTPAGKAPTIKKTPSSGEEEDKDTGRKKPASFRRTPTGQRTPSFGEQALGDNRGTKPEVAPPVAPSPAPPLAIPPLYMQPAMPPNMEAEVDAWERAEMAKINQRYEKLSATVLEWEDKKKNKARRKLETTQNELDTKRAKAMHKYQIEMEQIKEIADGARAQAKEKKRNEELKVKEKANRYREMGELPQTSACRCW